jgi:hypothetical protein
MGADTFTRLLLKVLRAHPAGLSEFELIQQLEAAGQPGFEADCLRDKLSLFQTHFFLFHTLYQLRDRLWSEQQARLDISALRIQLLSLADECGNHIAEHDPLRDYYLNIDNLEKTSEQDVEQLLNQFWSRFVRNDDRQQALAELELADPVDWPTIKQQYRRLAMQHHPDRGGDEERLQAINAAMEMLTRDGRQQ